MLRWGRVSLVSLLMLLFLASACRVMDPVIRRTATPIPEWVPTPRGYAYQTKLFDDFSDPASGWEIGEYGVGSVGYSAGEYFVRCQDGDVVAWGQRFAWYQDVDIEVIARQAIGPDNDNTGYGVMCRVHYDPDVGELEGYAFLVAGDGYYAIARFVQGDPEYLVEWTQSQTVRQGSGSNELNAICSGKDLTFFVNGVLVADAWDEQFSSGDIALIGTTYEPGVAEFRFDNLSLTSP